MGGETSRSISLPAMTTPARLVAALLACLLVLGACGGGSSDTTPPEDPAVVLAAAGAAMQSLQSARFQIELEGAPLILTAGLGLKSVDGQWTTPGSARAISELGAGDVTVQVGAISIDGTQWITNPVTGDWEELPSGLGFDPNVLFAPDTGWQVLLTEDLSGAELVGTEDGLYRIRAQAAGERVEIITAGLAGAEPVEVELWIDPATSYVNRLFFVTTSDDGATEWRLTISEFDEPVTIEPPVVG